MGSANPCERSIFGRLLSTVALGFCGYPDLRSVASESDVIGPQFSSVEAARRNRLPTTCTMAQECRNFGCDLGAVTSLLFCCWINCVSTSCSCTPQTLCCGSPCCLAACCGHRLSAVLAELAIEEQAFAQSLTEDINYVSEDSMSSSDGGSGSGEGSEEEGKEEQDVYDQIYDKLRRARRRRRAGQDLENSTPQEDTQGLVNQIQQYQVAAAVDDMRSRPETVPLNQRHALTTMNNPFL